MQNVVTELLLIYTKKWFAYILKLQQIECILTCQVGLRRVSLLHLVSSLKNEYLQHPASYFLLMHALACHHCCIILKFELIRLFTYILQSVYKFIKIWHKNVTKHYIKNLNLRVIDNSIKKSISL